MHSECGEQHCTSRFWHFWMSHQVSGEATDGMDSLLRKFNCSFIIVGTVSQADRGSQSPSFEELCGQILSFQIRLLSEKEKSFNFGKRCYVVFLFVLCVCFFPNP